MIAGPIMGCALCICGYVIGYLHGHRSKQQEIVHALDVFERQVAIIYQGEIRR